MNLEVMWREQYEKKHGYIWHLFVLDPVAKRQQVLGTVDTYVNKTTFSVITLSCVAL